ncbi:MAG: CBS domain-containing protein [Candidatus Bathyarchaeota archaeon]|nr:CBS domain-containing protein [Candidatus Bathyarchaeota archaeon]MDH5780348.1 CBS domain-containing protein [Candidatus Bathyarchaeota archaeon]
MSGILLVREAMTTNVKTVRPFSTVKDVVQKMNKFGIGSVVVVEENRPVGIITERDIMRSIAGRFFDPSVVKAKDIMSTQLVTISGDVSVEEAARLMANRKIKKLPVVEDEKLVGIVTSMDVLRVNPKILSLLEELLRTKRA